MTEKMATRQAYGQVLLELGDKYSNLVVLDGEKYIGIVSRANIFKAYRKMLIDVTHE